MTNVKFAGAWICLIAFRLVVNKEVIWSLKAVRQIAANLEKLMAK